MADAVELATAYVSMVVESSRVAPGVTRQLGQVEREADRTGKRAGKKLGGGVSSGLKTAAAGFGGILAGGMAGLAIKDFLGDALGEARESQKVGKLTESIIRSTGGAAKVTASQVGDLAGALSAKTGVDDEVIQSSANMLLTFKQVRNEVGKGNNVFDRATAAAQDLAAAGFGDASGQAKMLGKALNDPVRGMSALSRSGVTFTQAQKDQVKALVESGDTLKAQKIILAEVESQVGGSAEASATAGDKARVAMGNLKETIGTALLPVVDKVATVFTEKVAPAVTSFVEGIQSGAGAGGKFKEIVSQVAGAVKTAYEWLKPVGSWVVENKEPLAAFVAVLGGFLVINKIVAAVKALSAAFAASPIGWVTIAVAALAAGLVLLYKKNETFRNFVNRAWASIKDAVGKVVAWFKNTAWPWMRDVFTNIGKTATWLWTNAIRPAFSAIGAIVKWLWQNIYQPYFTRILGIAKTVFGWIKNTGWPIMRTALSAIGGATRTLWTKWIKPNFDRIKSGAEALVGAFRSARDGIGRAFSTLKDKIAGPIRSVLNWINRNFIGPVNSMLSKVGAGFSIPTLGGGGAKKVGGRRSGVQKYATGGHVHGWSPNATADNIPAWLTAGEFVLPVKATDRLRSAIGDGGLEALRRGSLPGYAMGGKVGGLNPAFRRALDGFNAAAGGRFSVISGLRSYADQVRLYNLYLSGRGNLAARPGTSRHESGNAADLYPSNARDTHGALARRFGLHFPVPGEAWHVEMVGGMRRMLGGLGKYVGIGNARKVFGGLAGKVIDQGKKALDAILDKAPGGFWSDAIVSAVKKITALLTEKVKAAAGAGATSDKEPRGYARGGIVPAVFDNGGTLAPGLNLVHNKLGRPEPLVRPEQVMPSVLRATFIDHDGVLMGTIDGRIDNYQADVRRVARMGA